MITIRAATANDLAALDDIMWAAAWTHVEDRKVISENAAEVRVRRDLVDMSQVFVASRSGKPAAFAALEYREDAWELESLFVAPESMRAGLGRALVDHAKAFVADAGGQQLYVQANMAAQEFYVAMGFELTKDMPHRAGRRMQVSVS